MRISPAGKSFELSLVLPYPWTDPPEVLNAWLEAKLRHYLSLIQSGAIARRFPASHDREVMVAFRSYRWPDQVVGDHLSHLQQRVARAAGVRFALMPPDSVNVELRLPDLGANEPPPRCPACGEEQVSIEWALDHLQMDYEPGCVVYSCSGFYGPPGEGMPREPGACPSPPLANVVAVVAARAGVQAPVLSADGGHAHGFPWDTFRVCLTLPRYEGTRPPPICPLCGAAATAADEWVTTYACEALYTFTAGVDVEGRLVPEVWSSSLSSCQLPPTWLVLHELQRTYAQEPDVVAACQAMGRALGLGASETP